jgi:hypothetical protein
LAQNFGKVEERDAFRVEFRIDAHQAAEQRLAFFLPGKERAAVVVYSAPMDRFTTARLAFETSIQATRGLDEPEPDRTGKMWRWILSFAVAALGGGYIRKRFAS